MRVSEEPNVDALRHKADVLESENERLSKSVAKLTREVLSLKGMSVEAIELNLPGLLAKVTSPQTATPPSGSERRRRNKNKDNKPQTGHGPTAQPSLEVIEQTVDLDEADKVCTSCGGDMEQWQGADDEVEVVDIVERTWVIRKLTLKKYRCQCGGCVETAEGPLKLIKGGRFTLAVAIATAVAKYMDHLPLDRQARMALRQGLRITSQTLWDQIWALAELVAPDVKRIKQHLLAQPVVGADATTFKLIGKGGSVKWQAWQLSCPQAIHFEFLPSKSAADAQELFVITDDEGAICLKFAGVAVVDGAAELAAVAKALGFDTAGCWSHARRNVLKAHGEAPGQVEEFIDLVGELYAVEHKAVRDPPSDDTSRGYRHLIDNDKLRVLRDTESRAVMGRIEKWIAQQTCVPGGLLLKALKYVADRWTTLTRCLDDPLIPLDNNLTESRYVPLALGRRNYLGARSKRGCLVAARFYSIFETAHVCGISGEAWLSYAAQTRLRGEVPLLPHEWTPAS